MEDNLDRKKKDHSLWEFITHINFQLPSLPGSKDVGGIIKIEPVHETSNNKVRATSKTLDQPAYPQSDQSLLSRLSIL